MCNLKECVARYNSGLINKADLIRCLSQINGENGWYSLLFNRRQATAYKNGVEL